MDIKKALIVFDALSQEIRLRSFRLPVKAGRQDGVAAGVLNETLNTSHKTLSFHLDHLSNVGLVSSKKSWAQYYLHCQHSMYEYAH